MPAKTFSPAGQLWLSRDGENVLNDSRIALLEQIRETGSITKAGNAVGISYRTAWITVDHLNTISDSPLVERTAGGKSGGGTRLTEQGHSLVRVYRAIQAEHGKYMARLREGIHDFDRFLHLTRKIALKTSARNQLFGIVGSIRAEGLTATVILDLKGGDKLRSRITLAGLESLGLRKGEEAYALIKANWIHAAGSSGGKKADGENRLPGEVISVKRGGKEAEVVTRLKGGNNLVAMIPSAIAGKLRLEAGKPFVSAFQAADVILGVAR